MSYTAYLQCDFVYLNAVSNSYAFALCLSSVVILKATSSIVEKEASLKIVGRIPSWEVNMDLTDYLVCPACNSNVKQRGPESLICENCGELYKNCWEYSDNVTCIANNTR